MADTADRVAELEAENVELKRKLLKVMGYCIRADDYQGDDDWNQGYRRAMHIIKWIIK